MTRPKVAVLRTDFKHHGDNSGYKQILKYLNPAFVFGLDQNVTAHHENRLYQKYLWLYEFDLFKHRKEIDILFIMYAEEFYRFSWRFMKKAKIVATFHMPPELLAKEIYKGNQRGRVGQITHFFNKRRFSKIDAAIVTSENQKRILRSVIPEERIHLIPLGVHIAPLLEIFENKHIHHTPKVRKTIITTGNWLRDWEFYFQVVKACPEMDFILVNRKLEEKYVNAAPEYPNLSYLPDISDEELFDKFLHADLHFLPLEAIAGSNALLQSLALGCPVMMTDYDVEQFKEHDEIILLYKKNDLEDCIQKIKSATQISNEAQDQRSDMAVAYVKNFDWSKIAADHQKLFEELLNH